MEIVENRLLCNCKKVTFADVENAMYELDTLDSVEREFEEVQRLTRCSTGCGTCHNKIMDVISEIMSGLYD